MTALVQSQHAANAGGTAFTCSITSTGGNTLVASITAYNSANTPIRIASITDSAGGTWTYSTALNSQSPPAGGGWDAAGSTYGFAAAACRIGAGAVTSVTVTFAAAVDFAEVGVQEYSGLPPGSVLIGAASSGTPAVSVTSYAPPAITTTVPVLAVSVTSAFNGWSSAGSGWSLLSYADPLGAYSLAAAAGTVQAAFTAGSPQDVPSSAVLAIGQPLHYNPSWSAARAGMPDDASAANSSGQIDQFLALHGITPVYAGNPLVTPSGLVGYGYGGITWTSLGAFDVDQPFTMPGGHTVIGRVTVPLSPQGSGADVTVSLCADSAGSPGTVIASAVLPREHLAQLAAPSGFSSAGVLATAANNRLVMGDMTVTSWQSPVAGSGAPSVASFAQSGQFQVQAGGNLTTGAAYTAAAFTVGWQGGSAPGTVLPQPPLPAAVNFGTLIATDDVLVYAGGQPTSGTVTANVSAAGWSPSSGQVQSWTAQTALPQAVFDAAGAFDPSSDTVYVIGGETSAAGGSPTTAVWRCTVTNGQLGSWTACPPLPAPRQGMAAAVVNGWLVAAGGNNAVSLTTDTWCAPVLSGGAIGSWFAGPAMPQSGGVPSAYAATSSGLAVIGSTLFMTLTVSADGPGTWQSQALNTGALSGFGAGSPVAAFAMTPGEWQVIAINPDPPGQYASGVLSTMPAISVPLPATGLTGGGTYHLLIRQDGGTAADYVQVAAIPGAQTSSGQTRPASGGSWTPMSGHLYSLPAAVFDQSPGGTVMHLREDSGQRVTTLLYGSATGLLLGVLEATAFLAGAPRPMAPAVTQVTYGSTGEPSGLVQLA